MEDQLDPSGGDVTVDEITLRTPGLRGKVRVVPPVAAGMRAEAEWSHELETALRNENVRPQVLVELSETEETGTGGGGTRSTRSGEDAMELEIPAPSRGWGQMVLYTDEAGVTTWEFARDQNTDADLTRGSSQRTYVIRRRVPLADATFTHRGLISAVGKKLLAVVAYRLVDPVIGAIGEHFAERWEEKKRPYRLRSFTVDDYSGPDAQLIEDRAGWEGLAGGRALLLVHGTFSRAHTGFGAMPREFVEALHRIYEGRVFAFDHFTLSHSPKQNVKWLLDQVPAEVDLELDIICHSRGGLVSRTLAERRGELPQARKVKVNRIVFVATPNSGTALADAKHMGTFIDSYTNLMNFLPDNGVTETLEGIVTVAKLLATGVLKGLDGLQSMRPQGSFLQWLNAPGNGGAASYFALAGDYEPTNAGWRQWVQDHLMDAIFEASNDLVVPTEGVFIGNGASRFPIAQRVEFGRDDGISHTRFFTEKRAQEKILEWLASTRDTTVTMEST